MTFRQSVFALASGRRRQLSHQPQRDCQFIQLEVRPKKSHGLVSPGFSRYFGNFNASLLKRMRRLHRLAHVVVSDDVLLNPLIKKTLAFAA